MSIEMLIGVNKRTGYLIVSQAQTSDSGVYKCLASNEHGNATAPAQVVVTGIESAKCGENNSKNSIIWVTACSMLSSQLYLHYR